MPRISLDGAPIEAQAQDTVAAALLRAGVTTFTRSIKYHRPRGPFCFAGSCGQCLMRIDGLPSLPACRVRVAEGMRCELRVVKLVIVGAGPAGLAAARVAGAGALLIEREGRAGGAELLFGAPVDTEVGRAEFLLDAECVGLY